MGHAFVIGETVVTSEEFSEKITLGAIERFTAESMQSEQAALEFSGGIVKGLDLEAKASPQLPQFEPIGIGKPMSIEILSVYTGTAPNWFPWGKPDLVMSSAIKGIETFDTAPRAINQLVEGISNKQPIKPSALAYGSPIVYYTPSLVNSSLLCTLEMAVQSFDKQVFQQISTLFSSAAGLPIFAPANAYLIAGSILIKIASKLAEALLQPEPILHEDIRLSFDTPGIPEAIARQIMIYNTRDESEMLSYRPALVGFDGHERVALVHKDSRREYNGNAPYMIINLDGRKQTNLDGFTPKIASAAILERFYKGADTGGQLIETLSSALELYNDFAFRQKMDRIKEEITALDTESPSYAKEKEAAEKLLAAYGGNIRNSLFKL